MVSKVAQAPTRVASNLPAVVVDAVSKAYMRGRIEVHALAGASLLVSDGEFVAVMGPSGSGKSTLLNLVAGLDVPTSGTITVHGQVVSAMNDDEATAFRRQHIGFIYQHFNVFPDLTIEQNVSVPLLLDGLPAATIQARVARALDDIGLYDRRHHLPTEISGGELQRAAIARALVAEPAIVLADEPTGNLDSATSERLLLDMRSAVDEQHRTIMLVTHDARAAAYADRIARLRDGAFEVS
jgi:putative ABC transport system ATP-binding protein